MRTVLTDTVHLAIYLTKVDDDRFLKTEMEQYPSKAEHCHLLSGYLKTKLYPWRGKLPMDFKQCNCNNNTP